MDIMNDRIVANQKDSFHTVLIEFTEKGNVQPLGAHEFRLMPRIGEKISKPESGHIQIYEVVDIHYTDLHSKAVAEVYVSHVGDSHDYLAGLKWKMKSADR